MLVGALLGEGDANVNERYARSRASRAQLARRPIGSGGMSALLCIPALTIAACVTSRARIAFAG